MTSSTVDELARSLNDSCVGVVDVDEVVAAIEATGINDRVAQQRYGLPTVFALGEAVLSYLHRDRAHQLARLAARATTPPRRIPYVRQALLRCSLYLTPVLLAFAASGPLTRIAWPAPAAALVIGWAGAQAMAYLAHFVGAHRGPGPAIRLLGAGFLGLAAAWSVVLAVAPERFVGPDRVLAYAVTLAELAYFAAVAAALVTGAESAVLLWTVPSWAVAAAAVAGWWPGGWPIGPEPVLLAGILATLARAFRHIRAPARTDGVRVARTELRRAVAYLLIGLGQALAFVLVWRAAPDGLLPPAAVPLLAAVPLIEVFVGWHTTRVALGLEAYDDRLDYHRDLRRVAVVTVAGLVIPLLAGAALGAVAYRLPYRISTHPDARVVVLALASGVLLGGIFAVVLLLATRRRLVVAAALAGAPVVLAAAIGARHVPTALAGVPGPLLPATVIALSLVYLAGLAAAAYVLFDLRSYR